MKGEQGECPQFIGMIVHKGKESGGHHMSCISGKSRLEGESSRLNESVRYLRTICEIFGPQGGDYAMDCSKDNLERCGTSDNVLIPAR